MADTKLLEYVALHLITHRLLKAGLLVALPSFDSEGTDLLILTEVNEHAKICRAQSKYRSLIRSSSSSISIPATYLSANLVVFLFIDDGSESYEHLYCFFEDDVSIWRKNSDNNHVLSFSKNTFSENLIAYVLNEKRIERIRSILETVDTHKEIGHFFVSQKNVRFESDEIYRDDTKIVRLEKTPIGSIPVIIDQTTGTENYGTTMPLGDPKEYDYDPVTDTWTAKDRE